MGGMATHLLFVCTGNICRSPMAEVLAQARAGELGLDVQVQSASLLGLSEEPADPKAVAVCKELGLDLSNHRAQPVTPALAEWADHILVMELRHATELRFRHPDLDSRIAMIGPFGGLIEISDPLGGWKFTFRRCRDQLRACVDGFFSRMDSTLA